MDKKNTLALFLIALVLLLTPYYFEIISPAKPKERKQILSNKREPIYEEPTQKEDPFVPLFDHKKTVITIETPLYVAKISNRFGGSFESFKLKKYLMADSSLVDLIDSLNTKNLVLSFVNINGSDVILDGNWLVDTEETYIEINSLFELRYTAKYNGSLIYKTLKFDSNSYVVDSYLDLSQVSSDISGDVFSYSWHGGLPSTENNKKDEATFFNGYVYQGKDSYAFNKAVKDLKQGTSLKKNIIRGKTEWTSIRSKYFISTLIPEKEVNICWASLKDTKQNDVSFPKYSMGIGLEKDNPSLVSLYLGPLEYDEIIKTNPGISSIMNFGWSPIRPISRGVLWLLKSLYVWFPNYGVVLILFSVLVKIVVYPLTKKSHLSMKKTQEIQPEITALREKHKNNPQKLQQATMALYKEKGVNPLGGCFPILIQMPLLFSLFQVFRSTIELRGAPFTLWIKDLSSPDVVFSLPFNIPLYGNGVAVLPVLMGATMYFQQKIMPTQTTGQQKYMSYFMTGFFVLLFNTFPSGLNLYYTLFNVLTIIQQKYLTPTAEGKPDKK